MDINHIRSLIERTAVYVPADCEGIRIEYMEEDHFVGVGEETGCEYSVEYAEVDLENDLLYELKLINS